MQETGIPVTYGYISDAHDQHGVAGDDPRRPRARARPTTSQQLHDYDDAFDAVLQPAGRRRHQQVEHAVRVHRRRGRPLRRRDPDAGRLRRRHASPCTLQPQSRRDQRQPRRACSRPEQGITTPFTDPLRHGADALRERQPGARPAATAACFGRGVGDLRATNPYTGNNENITAASPTRWRRRRSTWSTADPQRTPTSDDVRAPGLLPVRELGACDEGGRRRPASRCRRHRRPARSRGTTATSSRRSATPGSGFVGPGVEATAGRLDDVDRSHGHPADDAHARRPQRRLRPRRPRAREAAGRSRDAASRAAAPPRRTSHCATSTSS